MQTFVSLQSSEPRRALRLAGTLSALLASAALYAANVERTAPELGMHLLAAVPAAPIATGKPA
jgi:hypothetical protein